MNIYSQNNEQQIVEDYFGEFIGTLLSIGENNGEHLSNALSLIQKGWIASLVEPSPQVFPILQARHKDNERVSCYPVSIGDRNEIVTLYDSGELLGKGDRALVSSVDKNETKRWEPLNMAFKEEQVMMVTFYGFMSMSGNKKYDFISIDAEGFDIIILRQMDLKNLGCRCLCIEHNSIPDNLAIIREYVGQFNLTQIGYNAENVIFAKL